MSISPNDQFAELNAQFNETAIRHQLAEVASQEETHAMAKLHAIADTYERLLRGRHGLIGNNLKYEDPESHLQSLHILNLARVDCIKIKVPFINVFAGDRKVPFNTLHIPEIDCVFGAVLPEHLRYRDGSRAKIFTGLAIYGVFYVPCNAEDFQARVKAAIDLEDDYAELDSPRTGDVVNREEPCAVVRDNPLVMTALCPAAFTEVVTPSYQLN